jgi:hypothetical protein
MTAHKSQHYRRQQREGRVSHRSLGGNRGRNRNRPGNVPALRELIGESENAVQRRRRRFRLVPTKPHNQFFRVGDDRLGSLVVDHIGVGGKEDDVLKSCRIACRNPKHQLVGRRGRSRCERIGSGNMGSGGCEGGDPFGIRRERRSHRKGKVEVGFLGNTDIRTGEPTRVGRKRHIGSWPQIRRRLDCHRENGVVSVAIADHGSGGEPLGDGP